MHGLERVGWFSSTRRTARLGMCGLGVLTLVGWLAGCQQSGGAGHDDSAQAHEGVVATNGVFMAAVAAKDADGIAALYTEDAEVMPPNAPLARGRDQIRGFFGDTLAAGIDSLKLETLEVEGHGDTAHEVGRYELGAGGNMVDDGKYIVIWKRGADGAWKLHRDIFNSDRPAPSGEPAGEPSPGL